jgi:hypothetical protein
VVKREQESVKPKLPPPQKKKKVQIFHVLKS